MSYAEKFVVLTTFALSMLYIVLFNLNMPHYWSNSARIVPENVIDALWVVSLLFSLITLILCIRDSGMRDLANRAGWIAYMLLLGVIGIPHYYLKYGRHPRVDCI
jgi:hypothetical protein